MARLEEFRSPRERQNDGYPVPPLPTLDTAEVIETMGPQWKLPSSVRNPEDLIRPWIKFCESALEGGQLIRQGARERELRFNFETIGAWNYARRVLKGNFEEREEKMGAAKRAFGALLGVEEMKPGDADVARKLVEACEKELDLYARSQLLVPHKHPF